MSKQAFDLSAWETAILQVLLNFNKKSLFQYGILSFKYDKIIGFDGIPRKY